MLAPLPELLDRALSGGYAVGYFESWDSYSLEAVVEAADAESSPVILGFGCMMTDREWMNGTGIESLGKLGNLLAQGCRCPAALLLNEAQTFEQATAGIEAGFNAVMLDTSHWQADDALKAVRRLTTAAHEAGLAVEGELGALPDAGPRGIDAGRARLTDADEAARFVDATGVDCLAVAVGNVHLLLHGETVVDLDRLAAIHKRVTVPLVIHGGTGFPPPDVPTAISLGVAKFNVGTVLKAEYLAGIREELARLGRNGDVHTLVGSHRAGDVMMAAKDRVRDKVRTLMRLYGSVGRG